MKTILYILFSIPITFILFLIYWYSPLSSGHRIKKFMHRLWGYGVETDETMYYSNKFLDVVRYRNPFELELGISIRGVHVVQRRWHGFNLQREFYTMNMIRMVVINESFGRVARIKLMIEYSPTNCVYIDAGRFFKVEDARRFYEDFLSMKFQYARFGR